MKDALDTQKHPKFESYALVKQIKDELQRELPDDDRRRAEEAEQVLRSAARKDLPRTGHQRSHSSRSPRFDQIRDITIEVGVLPRVHGSALFTRGETQALVTATLGTTDDAPAPGNL